MPRSSREREVRDCVEHAGAQFDKCWEYLCDIKFRRFSRGSSDCLTQFQPKLAETLLLLNRKYQKIAGEKKRLIAKKYELDSAWFVSRMKLLSEHQKIIQNAVNVGLGLGDAFALFFYQNDSRHLRDHLSQKPIKFGPTGIGAIGELEFIRNVVVLYGYFVVFHGMTSVLRLGDISLIDLNNFKVAGLGEIKSHSSKPGVVNIELTFSGPGIDAKNLEMQKCQPNSTDIPGVSRSLDTKQSDRFKRQIKKMIESFKNLEKENADSRHSLMSEFGFPSLEKAIKRATSRRMGYERFGNGLLIAVFKTTKRSWWGRLAKQSDLEGSKLLVGLRDEVATIIAEGRCDNALFLGSIYYDKDGSSIHLPGMTHPVWWPIDMDLLKQIVFLETYAMTLFNPAHLIAGLEADGYEVSGVGTHDLVAEKRDGKKILRVEGFSHFMAMMQIYLYPSETILELIRKAESSASDYSQGQETRINMDIRQMM